MKESAKFLRTLSFALITAMPIPASAHSIFPANACNKTVSESPAWIFPSRIKNPTT